MDNCKITDHWRWDITRDIYIHSKGCEVRGYDITEMMIDGIHLLTALNIKLDIYNKKNVKS